MLISDSMPLLWLSYVALSLVVLVTGYLAIRWLPRLPRFVVTGLVAGLIWMPCSFTLPLLDKDAAYHGMAPAVVVAGIAVLQHDGAALASAVPLLILGIALGGAAAAGLAFWLGRRQAQRHDDSGDDGGGTAASTRRQEPVIG
ncbi:MULTISPECIES: hypothetical protein [unclassified Modicisalibacter]|uniref:hypothetical protein n=1 Tax=unclassified Modicisalibacter TaxID=2679913 RepID=UPI001CCFE0AF|nr:MULTISPECIES: hypothetical protein [unclassified Modicisalibacter]MBZ9560400.1 hypothetical protein [Modicisalibacter sp. R2A 31.J]MBZ9576309.1 hypothetical protein [Modicisalibacter sp. MOD 31.J]